MELGSFIYKRRKELNISQAKFSELTNYSLSAISKIESNITLPSLSSIILIANTLKIKIEDLLLLKDTPLNTEVKNKPLDLNIVENNFKTIRINKNYSQKAFAELIGVSRPTLIKIESGQSSPNIDSIIKVAETFNISINELLYSNLSNLISNPIKSKDQFILNQKKKTKLNVYLFSAAIFFVSALASTSLLFLNNPNLENAISNPISIDSDDMTSDEDHHEDTTNEDVGSSQDNPTQKDDTPNSETGSTTYEPPIISDQDTTLNSQTLYFGSYPQSLMADKNLIDILSSQINEYSSSGFDERTRYEKYYSSTKTDIYLYKDITYSNEKYRALYIIKNNFPAYQDLSAESIQKNGELYYFKFEPLKWRVLKELDEEKYLVLSDLLTTSFYFYNENNNRQFNPQDYAHSEVRAFLNGYDGREYSVKNYINNGFINEAFSNIEQSFIETSVVDNSAITTDSSNNKFCCENTEDKIFLLSYKDYLNSEYGFAGETSAIPSRISEPSQYAFSFGGECTQGGYMSWTRSPYSINDSSNLYPIITVFNGKMSASYGTFHNDYYIQPAMVLNFN